MNNNKGQTLLEVVIAMGIMVFGIFSIIFLSITSTVMSRQSTKELIATNLAREGIEVARNIRDSNWLEIESGSLPPDEWDKGLFGLPEGSDYTAVFLFDKTTAGGAWSVGWSPDSFAHGATDIYLDTDNIYRHKFPTETLEKAPYQRLIYLNPICDDGSVIETGTCTGEKVGIQVISSVRWEESGQEKINTIEERLYAWKY